MTMDFAINRRDLIQRFALLVGAASLPLSADALAAVANAGARQLDLGRYAVLVALADTIVPRTDTPGALDVKVPEYVDALLGNWASPARRTEFVAALDALDRAAKAKHQRGFAALTPAEREAVLIPYDADALKAPPATPAPAVPVGAAPTTVDPNYGRPKQEPTQSVMDRMSPRFADPGYGKLKELIVVTFYYSQEALTHDLAYEHNPGVWEPSIPITPATRPWGGVGNV